MPRFLALIVLALGVAATSVSARAGADLLGPGFGQFILGADVSGIR